MAAKKTGTTSVSRRVVERFAGLHREGTVHREAMSNLRPQTTGVEGAVIWMSAGEFSGADAQHGPRIKVMLGEKLTPDDLDEAVAVRLTDPPEVLGTLPGKIRREVIRFIRANRDVLLRHWNGELDAKEALDLIEKV